MGVIVEHSHGKPQPFTLPVPGGVIELNGSGLTTTRLVGLPPVDALPHDTDEYHQRAVEHGYGDDVYAMSREHECTHHLLARLLRLPCSPTLKGVATGVHWQHWGAEEAAVLAFQRYAKCVGADIVALLSDDMA
jgi:hypothetical protein